MAAAYVVTLDSSNPARVLQNGVDTVIVYANDATDAKAMAKAAMGSDANAQWDNATATAITAASNILGFRFVIRETLPDGTVDRTADVTATGAAQDTIDEIGAVLATALSGTYNSTSQKVTLDASGNGDHSLSVNVYPPESVGQDAAIPGFIAAVTHNGDSADELSFTLCADAFVVPALHALCTIKS